MVKETVPNVKKWKGCVHKLTLPLYARGEKSWESTQKISGTMIYICIKCGMTLEKGFVEKDVKNE